MTEPRRSVGDQVLDDLGSLLKEGNISSVTAPPRSFSSPARVAKDMVQGAGKTIAEQRQAIERLEAERKTGALVVELDPKEIAHSRFVNRHALGLSIEDSDFSMLLESLRTNGQDQAILVRPAPKTAIHEKPYEIAFGHRRHAAALIIDQERQPSGWKIKAHIKELTDLELVEVMDRENAERKEISPYELGCHYLKCIKERIYDSQTDLASKKGLSRQTVSRYIQAAELPKVVLKAFRDPRVIKITWLQDLQQALTFKRSDVLATAEALALDEGRLQDPEAILEALINGTKPQGSRPSNQNKSSPAGERVFRLPGSTRVGLRIVSRNGLLRLRWGKGIGLEYQQKFVAELQEFTEKHLRENPPPETTRLTESDKGAQK